MEQSHYEEKRDELFNFKMRLHGTLIGFYLMIKNSAGIRWNIDRGRLVMMMGRMKKESQHQVQSSREYE